MEIGIVCHGPIDYRSTHGCGMGGGFMKKSIGSVSLWLGLSGMAMAGLVVEDYGYRTGDVCQASQGYGAGDTVGGYGTNYVNDTNTREMRQWTGTAAANVLRHWVTNGVARSGLQCLRAQPMTGGSYGSINHLRSPTMLYPAGETGARTCTNNNAANGPYRPVVTNNYICSFWFRTVAANAAQSLAAGKGYLKTSADDGAGGRIGGSLWLNDVSGSFWLSWNQGFYDEFMNPYNWGYDTDPNPNPSSFSNLGDPEVRAANGKHVRGLESASVTSPMLDYGKWYKLEYRVDFADGNNNYAITNLFTPPPPAYFANGQEYQHYAATNPAGITESNNFVVLGAPSRYPNDKVTITVWDDAMNQVFKWDDTTVLTPDAPHLAGYPGGTPARPRTYYGLRTQESRGFGPGEQFQCTNPGTTNAAGFLIDDFSVSTGNGAYTYCTGFERVRPASVFGLR
jgi:hypothetical protein